MYCFSNSLTVCQPRKRSSATSFMVVSRHRRPTKRQTAWCTKDCQQASPVLRFSRPRTLNKKLGEERAPDRPACRRRKDLGLFAAACHSRRHTPDRRRRTPFFFAASKGNHGRERIAEDTMNVRSRYKTREPVEVVQQLESCHHESVTDFPLIEKSVFPEKYSDFRSKKGKNHPLKKAKSLFCMVSPHVDWLEVVKLL